MFLHSLLLKQKMRNLLARNARNLVKGIKFLKHYQHSPKYKGSSNSYLWRWRKDGPKKNWRQLEEKRMKLEQENDQRREASIIQMIQIFVKSKDT